jgi:hypothetical protein
MFVCHACGLLVKPEDARRHVHIVGGKPIIDTMCPSCHASMPVALHCPCEEVYNDEETVGYADVYVVYQSLWGGLLKWLGIEKK